jgi:hypothetical protein
MLLVSGDTIKTGAGASAVLGFDEEDKNIVRVQENTTNVILLKGDEKIELLQGEVFSIIQSLPSGSSFEIRTPTAVAGARGTEWATRYDGQETQVEAYEDVPFVKTIDEKGKLGEEMKVVTGYATRVARFAPPTRMSEIPAARRQQWQNQRQVMRQDMQGVRQRRGRPDRAKFQAEQASLKKGPKGDRASRSAQKAKKQALEAGVKPGEASSASMAKKQDQGLMLIGDDQGKGVQARKPSQFLGQKKDAGQLQEVAPVDKSAKPVENMSVQAADGKAHQPTMVQGAGAAQATEKKPAVATQNTQKQKQQQINMRAVQQAAKGVPSTPARSGSTTMQRR